jgi:hypothetical protein
MTGIIVAPGFRDSRIRCNNARFNPSIMYMNTGKTYLATPPPVRSVHFMIQPRFLCLVNPMSLGGKNESMGEFQVSIELLDAFYYVLEVDLKRLPTSNNLLPDKSGAGG